MAASAIVGLLAAQLSDINQQHFRQAHGEMASQICTVTKACIDANILPAAPRKLTLHVSRGWGSHQEQAKC